MLEICPAYIKQKLHLCDERVRNGGEIGPRTHLLDFLAIFTTKNSLKIIFFSYSNAQCKDICHNSRKFWTETYSILT